MIGLMHKKTNKSEKLSPFEEMVEKLPRIVCPCLWSAWLFPGSEQRMWLCIVKLGLVMPKRRRFCIYMNDDDVHFSISLNLKSEICLAGIICGSEEDWEFMWEEYIAETDASEKWKLLSALGQTRESNLLARYVFCSIILYKARRMVFSTFCHDLCPHGTNWRISRYSSVNSFFFHFIIIICLLLNLPNITCEIVSVFYFWKIHMPPKAVFLVEILLFYSNVPQETEKHL